MRRLAFGVLWTFVMTFVFLFLSIFGCCVAAVIMLKGDPEQNRAVVEEAGRQSALPQFFGSLAGAVVLSALGVLPGTRRRPRVATTRGVAADYDFSPVRPIIVVPVGTREGPPPELAALGPPLSVHAPGSLASMSGFGRLAMFVLGLLLFYAPVAVLDLVGREELPKWAPGMLVLSGIVAGLTCLLLAVWPRSPYSYQVHDEALVVRDRKTMRIIGWDQIRALRPELPLLKDLTIVLSDGQEVPITSVRGYHQLVGTVQVQVRNHLLPLMVKKACAGRMVDFGPLGISGDAVCYRGTTVPWDEVTKLVIVLGSGLRHLMIYRRGLLSFLPFCSFNLNKVPNDLLLLELLKHIAPDRLLAPAEARW